MGRSGIILQNMFRVGHCDLLDFFILRERASDGAAEREGEREVEERGTDRESQAGSALSAQTRVQGVNP